MVIGEWGIGEIINNPILQKKQDQKIVSDPLLTSDMFYNNNPNEKIIF